MDKQQAWLMVEEVRKSQKVTDTQPKVKDNTKKTKISKSKD